jgi:hypothetical protein
LAPFFADKEFVLPGRNIGLFCEDYLTISSGFPDVLKKLTAFASGQHDGVINTTNFGCGRELRYFLPDRHKGSRSLKNRKLNRRSNRKDYRLFCRASKTFCRPGRMGMGSKR